MIKNQLLLLLFLLSFLNDWGQVINRMYVNGNIGFVRHADVGAQVHFLKHFVVGGYATHDGVKVADYFDEQKILRNGSVKDKYDFKNLLVGVVHGEEFASFSVTVGPSWLRKGENHDIVIHTSEYSKAQWFTSTIETRRRVGLIARADMNINLLPFLGLNVGGMYIWNPLINTWFFNIGLTVGIVDEIGGKRWQRMAERNTE